MIVVKTSNKECFLYRRNPPCALYPNDGTYTRITDQFLSPAMSEFIRRFDAHWYPNLIGEDLDEGIVATLG